MKKVLISVFIAIIFSGCDMPEPQVSFTEQPVESVTYTSDVDDRETAAVNSQMGIVTDQLVRMRSRMETLQGLSESLERAVQRGDLNTAFSKYQTIRHHYDLYDRQFDDLIQSMLKLKDVISNVSNVSNRITYEDYYQTVGQGIVTMKQNQSRTDNYLTILGNEFVRLGYSR